LHFTLSTKRNVGRTVLASHFLGFLGILFIGERALLLPVLGFITTVVFGLLNAPKRPSWSGQPGGTFAWAPFPIGPALFLLDAAILLVIPLLTWISGGRGLPDLGHAGLLLPHDRYMLSDHGVRTAVDRWRFIVTGLLFYSVWFAGGSFVTALVFFFKRAPSMLPERDA
jgi:hypothetical protein